MNHGWRWRNKGWEKDVGEFSPVVTVGVTVVMEHNHRSSSPSIGPQCPNGEHHQIEKNTVSSLVSSDCVYLLWLCWEDDRGSDFPMLLTVIVGCRGGERRQIEESQRVRKRPCHDKRRTWLRRSLNSAFDGGVGGQKG